VFSRRLNWHAEPNALAKALAEHRGPLLDLTESNPTRAGLVDADLRALGDPRAARYEPSPRGLLAAREAVSAYYGGAVSPERIWLTASTSEAYAWLFQLLCDPGDEVLIPRPSYPLFEFLAGLQGVTARQYSLHYHEGWWLDLEALERSVTARTRAVVAVSPNNPTGHYLQPGLADLCARRGLALIADEVFLDFPVDRPVASTAIGEMPCLTFTLSGLSKVCGLPQMKLGWIVANGAVESKLDLVADTYLSVSAPVQYAAEAWLAERGPYQRRTMERVRANLTVLRAAGSDVLRVEGGWSAIARLPATRGEDDWMLALIGEGVLVQPGFFYDFESEPWAVLSLITPPEIFREGVERLIACQNRIA